MTYWKILEASSSREAKDLMSEEEQASDPIHLVISDHQMPDASGLDFIMWMRSRVVGREKESACCMKLWAIIVLKSVN